MSPHEYPICDNLTRIQAAGVVAYGLAIGQIIRAGGETAENAKQWLRTWAWRRQRRPQGPRVVWNRIQTYKNDLQLE